MVKKRVSSLALLLAAYFVVGGLYVNFTPDWQAPDEPAHYNYIRQLSERELPIIEPGDYDQAYQSQVISSRFDPQYEVASFEYEDHQPPLYYLVQTPLYWLTGGELRALRLLSLLFGSGIVIVSFLIAQRVFPEKDWLALTTAAFVAFLPQHLAMLASVNNDSLAELLIGLILLFTIDLVDGGRLGDRLAAGQASQVGGWGKHILIGILLGLGFLTKATVYIMAPVVVLALLWLHWRDWKGFLRSAAVVFLPAVTLGLIWWLRNLIVYGGADMLGLAAHNAVVLGQPRTADWIESRGAIDTLGTFLKSTFQSFWGQFGWMGVVMPAWIYRLLLLFSSLTVFSLGWNVISRNIGFRLSRNQNGAGRLASSGQDPKLPITLIGKPVAILLLTTFSLSLLTYLGYNITFVQHQGRYLFPALVPIAIGVAMGWELLAAPFVRRWPAISFTLPLGLGVALFGLDLLALFRFIVPALSF